MKKWMRRGITGVILVCTLTFYMIIPFVQAEEGDVPEQLYAQSAVLIDADSGRILYGKNENEIRPMASTTKIMTCILALEHMKEDQIAIASEEAAAQPKVKLGVISQEKFYLTDLLYSLMLESHNDSAVVVAEAIGGTVPDFAEMMNNKAREIGCSDTHFVTPNGLDASDDEGDHSTTAADLARIMRYCISKSPKSEEFLEITQTKNYQFTDIDGTRQYSCNNHNAFLDMMDGALSGKTGFTGKAGYCYVGALRRDDRTFIVALLACGWPNNKGYKWQDTKALMEYAVANYDYRNVWQNIELPELAVREGVDIKNLYQSGTKVPIHINSDKAELKVLLGKDENITVKKDFAESLTAPVEAGTVVGHVQYLLDGEEFVSYDILTDYQVDQRTWKWCISFLLEKILI